MIKILPLFCLLLILLSCSTTANEAKPENLTETEAREFTKNYDATWEKRDTNTMKEVMDEKYIYFTSAGSTTDRARILSWFRPADKYKVDHATRSEIVISVQGNVAIVSSRWIGSGSFGPDKFSDDQRCSLVLQKVNGKIKLMAEHCTQITK